MTKRQIWFYCKWSITTITSIAIIAFNLFLYLLFRIINIGPFNPKPPPQISFLRNPCNKLNYRVDFDRQIKKAHKYTFSLQYYPKIEPTYNFIHKTYYFGLKIVKNQRYLLSLLLQIIKIVSSINLIHFKGLNIVMWLQVQEKIV